MFTVAPDAAALIVKAIIPQSPAEFREPFAATGLVPDAFRYSVDKLADDPPVPASRLMVLLA
jgi:hypothetical protein